MNANDLSDLVRYFGTKAAIAQALNIRPQAVYQWKGKVPPLRALELERLTQGRLVARSRPGLYCYIQPPPSMGQEAAA